MKDIAETLGNAAVWLLAVFLILLLGYHFGVRMTQAEAIRHGLAERVITDQEAGTVEFRWRDDLLQWEEPK